MQDLGTGIALWALRLLLFCAEAIDHLLPITGSEYKCHYCNSEHVSLKGKGVVRLNNSDWNLSRVPAFVVRSSIINVRPLTRVSSKPMTSFQLLD